MNPSTPNRSVSHSASVQKTREASGATSIARRVAAAADAMAVTPAR